MFKTYSTTNLRLYSLQNKSPEKPENGVTGHIQRPTLYITQDILYTYHALTRLTVDRFPLSFSVAFLLSDLRCTASSMNGAATFTALAVSCPSLVSERCADAARAL